MKNENNKEVREYIDRTIRKKHSSLYKFCNEYEFSLTTLSEFLKGNRDMKLEMFLSLLEALEITMKLEDGRQTISF